MKALMLLNAGDAVTLGVDGQEEQKQKVVKGRW